MISNEKGSVTLYSLFAAVLLLTAVAAAILWSAISTTRHRLATAADLTALSAAQSLVSTGHDLSDPTSPCATAARIATLHKVHLADCQTSPTSVTVRVSAQVHLPFAQPTLTTTARAGPA